MNKFQSMVQAIIQEEKRKNDPCWKNYEMVGMKKKNGKEVPNCVPVKKESDLYESDEVEEGNAFSGARQDAIDHNKDEFKVGDKKYKVTGKKEKLVQETILRKIIRSMLIEAIYNGRKVKLNSPSSNTENPNKKSKVYVDSGKKVKSGEHKGEIKAKKVQFGDPNMRIKKSNPKRRKSFRARHNCANPGPKTKARYWSCKAW